MAGSVAWLSHAAQQRHLLWVLALRSLLAQLHVVWVVGAAHQAVQATVRPGPRGWWAGRGAGRTVGGQATSRCPRGSGPVAGAGLETWAEAPCGVSPPGLDVAMWVGWASGPVDVWHF